LRTIPNEAGLGGGSSARSPAPDVVGTDPAGRGLAIRIGATGPFVLLAFLATRCDGCDEFWRGFSGTGPGSLPGITPVIVTRGPDSTSTEDVARLADRTDAPVVMSDSAWVEYRVFGYPFLVLVESASRTVVAETVGFGWSDLEELVRGHAR
jgi:hypothetical protein